MIRKSSNILLRTEVSDSSDVELISTLLGVFKVGNTKISKERQIVSHKARTYPLSTVPFKRAGRDKRDKKLCILHHKCFHWYLLRKLVPQKSSSSSICAPDLHNLHILGCSICRGRGRQRFSRVFQQPPFTMYYVSDTANWILMSRYPKFTEELLVVLNY